MPFGVTAQHCRGKWGRAERRNGLADKDSRAFEDFSLFAGVSLKASSVLTGPPLSVCLSDGRAHGAAFIDYPN